MIHNLITSRAVPEIVTELGGTPVRTRVGHSYIKATMAETDAVFGGEHSGHFYFRDFWRADSGMLAALHTLAGPRGHRPSAVASWSPSTSGTSLSGEINSTVDDQAAIVAEIEAAYAGDGTARDRPPRRADRHHDDWWFNVRPSNTEPLLRLNVEGRTPPPWSGCATRCSPGSGADDP